MLCGTVVSTGVDAAEPPVTALAFTPDGKQVLAGSQSGIEVRAWPGLQKQKSLKTGLPNVHDLAFSPDGKWLLAAGGSPGEYGAVEVYSWPGAKRESVVKQHDDPVYAVAWKPDSSGWISAGLDHALVVCERGKRNAVRTISGHSRGVKAVAVLPDGGTLISGGIDNSLRVWSLNTGKPVRSFNNHTKPIHDLAVRPNRHNDALPMVVTASADSTVRLWQPTIGRMVRFVRLKRSVPLAVCWVPDGTRILAACSDGHLRVVDPDTVRILRDVVVLKGWAYSVAVHSAGRAAAVGGTNGVVRRVTLSVAR